MTNFRRTQDYWDDFFWHMAEHVATASKDPSRKVGAILVTSDRRSVSMGYNGLPAHLTDDPALLAKKMYRLRHTVHAEQNCVEQANFRVHGCTLYVTRFPCLDCARNLVTRGISRLVTTPYERGHSTWGRSWAHADVLLHGRGVVLSLRAEVT